MLKVDTTKYMQLYGQALGGDGLGCQDYTGTIELRGVTLVNDHYLEDLTKQRDKLHAALTALSTLEVKGHALMDRLQFSDEGRALAEQINEALKS